MKIKKKLNNTLSQHLFAYHSRAKLDQPFLFPKQPLITILSSSDTENNKKIIKTKRATRNQRPIAISAFICANSIFLRLNQPQYIKNYNTSLTFDACYPNWHVPTNEPANQNQ